MKSIIAALALIATLVSVAWAGPSEDAAQVVQRWGAYFDGKNLEGITKLYAPDALFWGTGSKSLVTNPGGVRSYFEQAFATIASPRVQVSEQKSFALSDASVTMVTMDALTGTRDGKEFVSPGRTTWVFAKRDGTWQIVHFHRSSVPR